MRTIYVRSRHGGTKPVIVPETYSEAYELIAKYMENGMGKGGDSALSSACERAVFGMFGDRFTAIARPSTSRQGRGPCWTAAD